MKEGIEWKMIDFYDNQAVKYIIYVFHYVQKKSVIRNSATFKVKIHQIQSTADSKILLLAEECFPSLSKKNRDKANKNALSQATSFYCPLILGQTGNIRT